MGGGGRKRSGTAQERWRASGQQPGRGAACPPLGEASRSPPLPWPTDARVGDLQGEAGGAASGGCRAGGWRCRRWLSCRTPREARGPAIQRPLACPSSTTSAQVNKWRGQPRACSCSCPARRRAQVPPPPSQQHGGPQPAPRPVGDTSPSIPQAVQAARVQNQDAALLQRQEWVAACGAARRGQSQAAAAGECLWGAWPARGLTSPNQSERNG